MHFQLAIFVATLMNRSQVCCALDLLPVSKRQNWPAPDFPQPDAIIKDVPYWTKDTVKAYLDGSK